MKKVIFSLLALALVITVSSCRDTKTEETLEVTEVPMDTQEETEVSTDTLVTSEEINIEIVADTIIKKDNAKDI